MSATLRVSRAARRVELADECGDEVLDLVADRADMGKQQVLGIGQFPVETAYAWRHRTDFFAAG
jgi:hypothetical protein